MDKWSANIWIGREREKEGEREGVESNQLSLP